MDLPLHRKWIHKMNDRKRGDREALALAIGEFIYKIRMREIVEEKLTRKILRLIHRGLRQARDDPEWCRFMLYAITTLLTDGWVNLEKYPGDKLQLTDFLIRIYADKVRLFGKEYWDML
jgi:hypothetical protein